MAPDRDRSRRVMRLVCLTGLCLPLLFLSPPLLRIEDFRVAINAVFTLHPGEIEELSGALWRTILLSLVVAFGSALTGLVASLAVVHIRNGLSRAGSVLLILPFFLGEAVIAFAMRQMLDSQWRLTQTTEWHPYFVLAIIATSQVLKFGSLFAFILTMQSGRSGLNRDDFAMAHGLSRRRYIRDVILPKVTSTFQVCSCMAFAATMVENTTAAIVFRASSGNHLELLTHWTARQYSLISKSSPQLARDFATVVSGVEFFATLLLGIAVFLAARPIARIVAPLAPERQFASVHRPRAHEFAALFLLLGYACLLVAAVIMIFYSQRHEMSADLFMSLVPFGTTSALGIVVGVITAALAALLAALCWMSWPRAFAVLSLISLLALSCALLMSAVPSTYMLLATYDWAFAVLRTRHGLVAWMVGHAATVLPLLFGFFIVTHFSVKAAEMDFQRAHNVPVRYVMNQAFLRRFLFTYVLGAFCAFSLVWNDQTINSAFSSSVPSFASALDLALEGRAASMCVAAACSTISLVIGLVCSYGIAGLRSTTT